MDKGIVSRAVKSLIDMRFVSRKASKDDGRRGHLFLTAKGARAYQAIATEVREVEAAMIETLSTDEIRTLGDALEKLSATFAR